MRGGTQFHWDPCGWKRPRLGQGSGLGAVWLEGALGVGFQAQDSRWLARAKVGGRDAGRMSLRSPEGPSPSLLIPSLWNSLQAWEPLPSSSPPQGCPSHPAYTFLPPHVLSGRAGIPPVPLVSKVPHHCLVGTLVVRRCKLCVLLPCHLSEDILILNKCTLKY